MAANRHGRPIRLVTVVVVLAALACGQDRSIPSPTQSTPTTLSAQAHLDALLEIMQANSINKKTIDWASFRTEVLTAAGAGQTIQDAYPAIAVALRLLNDQQSYYSSSDGRQIGPPPVGGCSAAAPTTPELPDTVGYVRVEGCLCEGTAAITQFAESIQRAIKTADRPGLAGWIVDFRGNRGGNMWPMVAGIGPILDEGIIGYIVYHDREYEREYRDGGAMSFGDTFAQVGTPYSVLNGSPKVAVLTDGLIASAGEAVVVYFKSRPVRARSAPPRAAIIICNRRFL